VYLDKKNQREMPMGPMMYYGTYPVPMPMQYMNCFGMQNTMQNTQGNMQLPPNVPGGFMPQGFMPSGYMTGAPMMPQPFFGFGGFPEEIEPEIEPDSN
jgi:hypothetical protein